VTLSGLKFRVDKKTMSRRWQKFVAPGPENEELPTDPSPWHSGRWARVPQEHWDLIIDFAERLDPDKSNMLRALSWAVDDNEMDYIDISAEDLTALLPFLTQLAVEIEHAEPLVPKATDEIPDRFINEEHVRMLNAVTAVIRESMRLNQPFRAWRE
jgi:hypothetical protein